MTYTFALILYWSSASYFAAATYVPMMTGAACLAAGQEIAKQYSLTTVECIDQRTGKVTVLK